ncbi:MAG TPA: hypothetical protein VGL65_01680 [Gemmatimonadales bacterium]|jgi:hypothetical protein
MQTLTRLFAGIIALLSFDTQWAEAQSLPGTNLTATARVRVVTMSQDTTIVSYSLLSDVGSLERLVSFKIKLTMTPTMIVVPSPDSVWVIRKLFSGITGASWVALAGIGAGDSTPTLTLKAIGLPGIATAWYHGDSLPVVDEDDSVAVANAPSLDPYADLSKIIQTVGVDTFPTSRTMLNIYNHLWVVTTGACNLGWITAASSWCNFLKGYSHASSISVLGYSAILDSARTYGGGSVINDAAYFMLRANTDYMLHTLVDTSWITLTYVCGNKFRIRSSLYASPHLVYDVTPSSDTTGVTAAGSTSDSIGYTDTFFTASTSGTVHLYYNYPSSPFATVANGAISC